MDRVVTDFRKMKDVPVASNLSQGAPQEKLSELGYTENSEANSGFVPEGLVVFTIHFRNILNRDAVPLKKCGSGWVTSA